MDAYPKGPDRRVASNILLTIITVLLVGLVLRLARAVVIPLLVTGFLAYLMDPLVALLRRLPHPGDGGGQSWRRCCTWPPSWCSAG